MGLPIFKNCATNYTTCPAPAPNPDPKRWELRQVFVYPHAYVLVVRYLDCTNFEGLKVMVYQGSVAPDIQCVALDPHFTEEATSLIARFQPTEAGIQLACWFAERLKGD
jgi:hypothetical protein